MTGTISPQGLLAGISALFTSVLLYAQHEVLTSHVSAGLPRVREQELLFSYVGIHSHFLSVLHGGGSLP